MIRLLEGRVAIVTGAASGIGKATAIAMSKEGAAVIVADTNAEGAATVATAIARSGGAAIPFTVDVKEEDQVSALIGAAVDTFGRLDVLHNNAASIGATGLTRQDRDLETMAGSVWDQTFQVNLKGPMLASKYAIPQMIEQGGGSIINTASISGLTGEADRFAYGASKAGLIALTRHIATRYGKKGIRCNAVAPGLIATESIRAALTPAQITTYQRHHLTPFIGEPEDIANVVVFLASDRARFITGQVINVDGGLLAHAPMHADLFDESYLERERG